MINPRSLVRALDKHWDVMERLVLLGRDQITYERSEVMALLGKTYLNEATEQHLERLQQLVNTELLIEMSQSNTLQLNESIRQFVGSLLHEHELGLSDILKARIIDIKAGLEQLHQALQLQHRQLFIYEVKTCNLPIQRRVLSPRKRIKIRNTNWIDRRRYR